MFSSRWKGEQSDNNYIFPPKAIVHETTDETLQNLNQIKSCMNDYGSVYTEFSPLHYHRRR